MAAKVKELAKSRTECAEREATIAAMKIDIQTLNKAVEEAKNKVQNSEEEVRIGRLQVVVHSYQLCFLSECKSVVYPHTLYFVLSSSRSQAYPKRKRAAGAWERRSRALRSH